MTKRQNIHLFQSHEAHTAAANPKHFRVDRFYLSHETLPKFKSKDHRRDWTNKAVIVCHNTASTHWIGPVDWYVSCDLLNHAMCEGVSKSWTTFGAQFSRWRSAIDELHSICGNSVDGFCFMFVQCSLWYDFVEMFWQMENIRSRQWSTTLPQSLEIT